MVRVKWHLLASLGVAAISLLFDQNAPLLDIRLFGHNVTVFVLCILVGVLMDVDHLIDISKGYAYGSLEGRLREGRLIVLFHGFENCIILIGLSVVFQFLIFPTISYVCHMMMDAYGNDVPFRAYFYMIRFGKKLTRV